MLMASSAIAYVKQPNTVKAGKVTGLECRPPGPSLIPKKMSCPNGFSWHPAAKACCRPAMQWPR
jgi:hypothetical protein